MVPPSLPQLAQGARFFRCSYDLSQVDIASNFIRPENFLFHSGLKLIPNASELLSGRAILDGGAYRGESAAVFRKNYPDCAVHAFEPGDANYDALTWMSENTLYGKGVVPVKMGLAAKSSRASMGNSGHGTSVIQDAQGKLQLTSIDDYAKAVGLEAGCIKLDIEGAEKAAIEGAQDVIKENRPILLISIYHTPEDFLDIAPMIHAWDLGYRLKVRHLHPQLTSFFGEFMLIATPDGKNP